MWEYRNNLVHQGSKDIFATIRHFESLVKEFSEFVCVDDLEDTSMSNLERWKCPPLGWRKINIDAAFCEGKAATTLILRNDKGDILQIASSIIDCESVLEAEVKAIGMETTMAEELRWNNLIFSSNSKISVNIINSKGDPKGWGIKMEVMQIKSRFSCFNWLLEWNHWSSNSLTDRVTNDSLVCSETFFFNFCNFVAIPTSFLDIAFLEKMGDLVV